jgi:hypothetical protein
VSVEEIYRAARIRLAYQAAAASLQFARIHFRNAKRMALDGRHDIALQFRDNGLLSIMNAMSYRDRARGERRQ